eukprot:1411162-Amphidinium_carterae.2
MQECSGFAWTIALPVLSLRSPLAMLPNRSDFRWSLQLDSAPGFDGRTLGKLSYDLWLREVNSRATCSPTAPVNCVLSDWTLWTRCESHVDQRSRSRGVEAMQRTPLCACPVEDS